MDEIDITVELADDSMVDDYLALERLTEEIQHKLRVVLQIDAGVRLVQPKTIARSEGKAKRIIDLRDKK